MRGSARWSGQDGRVRTVHLGQFTDDHADTIVAGLDEAGIVHWSKRTGRLTRVISAGDWGVRLFVDEERLDEAREVVRRLVGDEALPP